MTGPPDPEPIYFLLMGYSGYVAYDVGAANGYVSYDLADRFGEVYSFEPSPSLFRDLELTARRSPRIHPREEAVSDVDGMVTLDVTAKSAQRGYLSDTEGNVDAEDRVVGRRAVKARRVDSLIEEGLPAPDFIKIDVEGHEVQVLEGAWNLLHFRPPKLFIEIHGEGKGDRVQSLLSRTHKTTVHRHPHYPEGSALWRGHYYVTGEPK